MENVIETTKKKILLSLLILIADCVARAVDLDELGFKIKPGLELNPEDYASVFQLKDDGLIKNDEEGNYYLSSHGKSVAESIRRSTS